MKEGRGVVALKRKKILLNTEISVGDDPFLH